MGRRKDSMKYRKSGGTSGKAAAHQSRQANNPKKRKGAPPGGGEERTSRKKGPNPRKVLKVAVVGAGPAGLVVAAGLERESSPGTVTVTVYEKYARDRDQGSGWDIDSPGREALRRAGLDVSTVQRKGSDSFRLFYVDSKEPAVSLGTPKLFKMLGSWLDGGNDLETNRNAIIEGLLSKLKETTVYFDTDVQEVKRGRIIGTSNKKKPFLSEEYDVIIDATGTSSKLRGLHFTESSAAIYTGVTLLQCVLDNPERDLSPELVKRLGNGTMSVIGSNPSGEGIISIVLQRFGAHPDDKRTVLMLFGVPSSKRFQSLTDKCGLDVKNDPHALSKCLSMPRGAHGLVTDPSSVERVKMLFKDELSHDCWTEEYRNMLDHVSGFRILPVHMMPYSADTEKIPIMNNPLLSIGDALHALPPWSGTSGNFALRDASDTIDGVLDLVGEHALNPEMIDKKLRSMEKKFLERADGVGKGGLEARKRSFHIAKQMTEVWPHTKLEDFDIASFFGGGEESLLKRKSKEWMIRAITWLNSWE